LKIKHPASKELRVLVLVGVGGSQPAVNHEWKTGSQGGRSRMGGANRRQSTATAAPWCFFIACAWFKFDLNVAKLPEESALPTYERRRALKKVAKR
jgi:hypothetical protein